MTKIKVMDETLANKIAAGEVVEKCSSIVKELVENSIDAHAKSIIINLEEGGKKLIEVIDDGDGMNKEDAILAFQRHATSKIYKDDDLFFIDTLGFRGEALPSIASVSKTDLRTSDGGVGTHIIIEGGKLLENTPSDSRKGTSVKITNLFYNTPARLKYLKSDQSELASCVSFVERLALSHPEIAFNLNHGGSLVVKTSGSNDLLKTIHEIYGLQVSSRMLEVRATSDDFDLYGYVCKPEILKSNRNHMIVIVNDRIVRNMDINRAINDAYYTYKPDIKYPIVVLKITTDPTLVDVNIHPTKQDIKLSKMDVLYDLIVTTIKKALYQALLVPDAIERIPVSNPVKTEVVENIVKEREEEYNKDMTQTTFDFVRGEEDTQEEETVVNPEMKKLKLYPVGVAHGTYIIAEDETGIYLIDQHAAQERVNYERNMRALKAKEVHTTELLFPITIELSGSEFLTVKKEVPHLQELGFDIEEFGMNTFVIKAHPTWLREGYEEESIRRIIDLIVGGISHIDPVKFNESIAITLACKMSIKANMHISHEAQEELLNELCACDNPYNCPHGRPTIIKFSIYDLERMFKRSMN
ncbi:TPA: DNA mismatch repair endonuclease MutL [Candidatus Ventrenecus stercoripullorum]|nr:DNA mismatch repair endonuclease MutL [Candidatus Ventrenecus stercoripullorum]